VDKTWGVAVIHHGGSMAGYKSDLMFLPDYGIGAVLLTNSDNGGMLLRPMMRRLLEIVFDGKPEAVGNVDASAANFKAELAKERERLVSPPSADLAAKLARRYSSPELGEILVVNEGGSTTFDFGEWKSKVASRKNDDGTVSFISTDPTNMGFEFVVAERSGKRALVTRDGQHEYVFTERGRSLDLRAPAAKLKTLKHIRNLTLTALIALAFFHWPYVRAIGRKAAGQEEPCPWNKLLPMPVSDVRFQLLKQRYARQVKAVEFDARLGIQRFESPTRPFWIKKDGGHMDGQTLLAYILAEEEWIMRSAGEEQLRKGDVVVDIGAHIGTFGDDALRRGASKVIMVEPDPVNVECLRRNFREEIADGRVVVVPEGAWSSESTLEFTTGVTNSGTGSFVILESGSDKIQVPVRRLDDMLKRLAIPKVNFIKIDIEGAEREALKGARETMKNDKPRLMLDAYHLPDDPVVLPALIREANPAYLDSCPVCSLARDSKVVPHAIFFR
jgi:FkbM family methyltransferase